MPETPSQERRQSPSSRPLDRLADEVLEALEHARRGDPLRPAKIVVPARAATMALRQALVEAAWRSGRRGLAAVDVVVAADIAAALVPLDEQRPLLSEPAAVVIARLALASLPPASPLVDLAEHQGTAAELARTLLTLGRPAARALSRSKPAGATASALAEAVRAMLELVGDHWMTPDERWTSATRVVGHQGPSALGEATIVVVEGAAPEPGEAALLRALGDHGACSVELPTGAMPAAQLILYECDDPETEALVALSTLERLAPGGLEGLSPAAVAVGVPPTPAYTWAVPSALERLGVPWRGQDRRGHLGDERWQHLIEAAGGASGCTPTRDSQSELETARTVGGLRSWSEAAEALRDRLEANPAHDADGTPGPSEDDAQDFAWADELERARVPFSPGDLASALEVAVRRPVPHDDGPASVLVVSPDQLEATPLAGAVLLGCSEGVFPPPPSDPLAVAVLGSAQADAMGLLTGSDGRARRRRIERRLRSVIAGLGPKHVVLSRPSVDLQRMRALPPARWLASCSPDLHQRIRRPPGRRFAGIETLEAVVSPSPTAAVESLSATELVAYVRCPRRYLVEHVWGLAAAPAPAPVILDPPTWGQAVHAALCELGRNLQALPPGDLGPATRELLVQRSVAAAEARLSGSGVTLDPSWPEEARDCRRHVRHVLSQTLHRFDEEGWWVAGVELAWQIARGPAGPLEEGGVDQAGASRVVLHGRVDRIDVAGPRTAVVDYKTGGGTSSQALLRPVTKALDAGRFALTCHPDALQLACYAEALRQDAITPEGPDPGGPDPGGLAGPAPSHEVDAYIWATADPGPPRSLPASQLDPDRLHLTVALALQGLRQGWFPPHPTTPGRDESDANCRGCPARGGLCPADALERWSSVHDVDGLGEPASRTLSILLDGHNDGRTPGDEARSDEQTPDPQSSSEAR